MKKYLVVVLLFFAHFSFSQEYLPIHSQYLLGNYFLLNPAVAGIDDSHKLRTSYRNQWIGESQSPNTITLSYQGRLNRYIGIGGYVFSDRNGYHRNNGFEIGASYQIDLGTNRLIKRYLSFGLAFAGRNSDLKIGDLSSQDPALNNFQASFDSGFNAGGYFIYNNYYGGVSISRVLSNLNNPTTIDSDFRETFSVILGYVWFVDRLNVYTVEPSLLVRNIKGIDTEVDLNYKMYYKPIMNTTKFWFGASLKSFVGSEGLNLASLTPFVGIDSKNFSLGYSFDIDINNQYLGGNFSSHQLVLGFNLFEKRYNSAGCAPLNF